MAEATTSARREEIASAIRSRRGFTSMAGPLDNAIAQKAYGDTLAQREAALKLPAAFDAAREATVRHGESIRKLTEEFDVAKQVFTSVDAAVGNLKEGLLSVGTTLLQQLSPSSIAQGLVGGLVHQVDSFVSGLISNAVGGVRHTLFGSNSEERTAARLAADSAKALSLGLDAVTQSLGRNALGAAIDNLQIGLIGTLQAINTALPGTKNEAARNAARAQATRQESEQEKQLRDQYAQSAKYASEDLAVRNLKAIGRTDEAGLLGFREQQQREMDAAKLSHPTDTKDVAQNYADALYLNTLQTVLNNELLAYQNGLLSTAMRNAPTGFYGIEAYAGAYATPRGPAGYPTDSGSPVAQGAHPNGPITLVFKPGALVVDKNGMMNVVLEQIDQSASSTNGAGTSRSAALDRMARR
jgi:hypothetical protein